MSNKFNIAILGATGIVGQTALQILQERKFPVDNIYLLASERSKGSEITFNDKKLTVLNADEFDFSKVQLAIFSAGADISEKLAPKAAAAGCIVIDNTTAFRYDNEVPLVVPEVNPEAISGYRNKNIIANPNCSTIQMVVVLKPLYDAVGIKRINFTSYQSVSGAGKAGISELMSQSQDYIDGDTFTLDVFSAPIAFNVIPCIDVFLDNGFTKEEMKVVWETQKIFSDSEIEVNPTAVRVPVVFGHSESLSIETQQDITPIAAREILSKAKGITLLDDPSQMAFPMPIFHGEGTDDVYVGRVRQDLYHTNILNLWIVADNVRKGAALNAVQIAEKLIEYL